MTDWSSKLMVFSRLDPKTQWDIWTMPECRNPEAPPQHDSYLQTEFNEHDGMLSPTGDGWRTSSTNRAGGKCPLTHSDQEPEEHLCRPTAESGHSGGREGRELFHPRSGSEAHGGDGQDPCWLQRQRAASVFTLRNKMKVV